MYRQKHKTLPRNPLGDHSSSGSVWEENTLAGTTGWAKVNAGLLSVLLSELAFRTVESASSRFMSTACSMDQRV